MAELRSVDPRLLTLNPNNPRTSPVPKEMDQQLVASIKAIGLLQPPLAREIDGVLVIRAGDRRTKAAIAAGKELIDVYVLDGNEDIDAMAAMSENLVRVSLTAPAFTALLGDRSRLRAARLDKRTAIARLETAWVAAAEADAASGRGGSVRMRDRETWDRGTWDRYLAAASRHEPDFMPRIKRLLGEIDNIDKLLALPTGQEARAA